MKFSRDNRLLVQHGIRYCDTGLWYACLWCGTRWKAVRAPFGGIQDGWQNCPLGCPARMPQSPAESEAYREKRWGTEGVPQQPASYLRGGYEYP